MFHQEGTEDNFLEYLADIFQFLCPFHILIPVDICIDLHPEQAKTQAIERRLVQGYCFPVYGLDEIREQAHIFKCGEEGGKYR